MEIRQSRVAPRGSPIWDVGINLSLQHGSLSKPPACMLTCWFVDLLTVGWMVHAVIWPWKLDHRLCRRSEMSSSTFVVIQSNGYLLQRKPEQRGLETSTQRAIHVANYFNFTQPRHERLYSSENKHQRGHSFALSYI